MFAVHMGLEADDVCRESGFGTDDVSDADRRIPWAWYVSLRRTVIRKLPDVSVGLELARFATLSSLGYLGLAVQHCPTLYDALEMVHRFASTMDSAPSHAPVLEKHPDVVHLVLIRTDLDPPEATQAIFVGCLQVFRGLTGHDVRPKLVQFAAAPDRWATHIEQALGCPVTFDAEDARVVFRVEDLRRPILGANASAMKACETQLDKIASTVSEPFVSVVSRVIEAQVSGGEVKEERTARKLGLSLRSLQRKLSAHGVTHHGLVCRIRLRIAEQALLDRSNSVEDVASAAGYKDPSSFNRAFRRWTGKSPRAYRNAATKGVVAPAASPRDGD